MILKVNSSCLSSISVSKTTFQKEVIKLKMNMHQYILFKNVKYALVQTN